MSERWTPPDVPAPRAPRWMWLLAVVGVIAMSFAACNGWLDDQEQRRPGSTNTNTTQEVTP